MSGNSVLVRLAVRTALRNKLRSLLIFALIALLVGAGTALATIARSNIATDADRRASVFGQADLLVDFGPDRGRGAPVVWSYSDLSAAMSQSESPPQSLTVEGEAAPQWLTSFDARDFAAGLTEHFGAPASHSRSYSARAGELAPRPGRDALFGFGTPRFIVDLDLGDPLSEGIYTLRSGRPPAAPNEVVVASNVAPTAGVAVGDELELSGARFVVVGTAAQPAEDFFDSAVLTPEGLDRAAGPDPWITHHFRIAGADDKEPVDASEFEWTGAPASAFAVSHREVGVAGIGSSEGSGQASRMPVLIATVATAVFGIQIALIASSAFAVGVRRRVVEFGQLMTTGATAGHIRRLVVVEAALLGLLGAVAGTAAGVGIASWLLEQGTVSGLGTLYARQARLAPIDWLGPAAIGVVASAVAAWRPARTIASVPVATALAGRIPTTPRRNRTPLWGLGAAALGTAGTLAFTWQSLYGSHGTGGLTTILILIVGSIVLIFVGFLTMIGSALAFLGRRADRLPVKARLVARNSDRHQSLAWASVAAFVAVLAMPVVSMAAVEAYPSNPSRPANHVAVVSAPAISVSGDAESIADPGAAARNRRFLDAFEEELDARIGSGEVIRLRGVDRVAFRLKGRRIDSAGPASTGLVPAIDTIALATPELVAALGLSDEAVARLDSGTVLLLDQGGDRIVEVSLESERSDASPFFSFEAFAPDLGGRIFDTPGMLINEEGAAQFGVDISEVGMLYITESALTSAQAGQIRSGANEAWSTATAGETLPAIAGLPSIEIGQDPFGLAGLELRLLVSVSAALAALIALIGAALAAVEVDRDIGSMIATGASPSIRRWLLGAQTTYHLGLAAALAVPLGLLVFWASSRADENGPEGLILPWGTMGLVAFAIPLGVGLVIALVFRSGKPVVSRRLS